MDIPRLGDTSSQPASDSEDSKVVSLLRNIIDADADLLKKLSEQDVEFRSLVRNAIPEIIDLLWHSELNARMVSSDALLKIAEQAEFHESIRAAIPQIVTLLRPWKSSICEVGANALLKLSEQAEFREPIKPAVCQIIALLSHSGGRVREAGAETLSKLSEQAEFREAIRPATPQAIALLSNSNLDVFKTGADALVKLSEQAEFREPIIRAIPRIIGFLRDSDLNIRSSGVGLLAKLSERAEFRDSIRPAIPHIISLLSDSNPDVCKAGADALVKLLEQAEFQPSIWPAIPQIISLKRLGSRPDIPKMVLNTLLRLSEQFEFRESIMHAIPQMMIFLMSDQHTAGTKIAIPNLSELAEFRDPIQSTISRLYALLGDIDKKIHEVPRILSEIYGQGVSTCWIAAERALQHAKNKMSSVSKVFDKSHIKKSQYLVLAGFDDSLVRSGIAYLEQIHIFVTAEINTTSPLLSKLGKLFSPFSSVLFTESHSYRLPVFKEDGSLWDFDELIYFTASKSVDGGPSSKTSTNNISLTPSQGDDANGSGDGDKRKKLGKGKGRDVLGEADSDDDDNDPDSRGPSGDGIKKITFTIDSDIHLKEKNSLRPFQNITTYGTVTIKTTPEVQNPPRFSKRFVQFTELEFSTEPPQAELTHYALHQIQVVIDSKCEKTYATSADLNPRTPPLSYSIGEETKKSGSSIGFRLKMILGMIPRLIFGVDSTKIKDLAKEPFCNVINSHSKIRWDFDISDSERKGHDHGLQVSLQDRLPSASFEFIESSSKAKPAPPKNMDITLTSYWKLNYPSDRKSRWINKISGAYGDTLSYSNLLQKVTLNITDLYKLSEPVFHKAEVEFKPREKSPI